MSSRVPCTADLVEGTCSAECYSSLRAAERECVCDDTDRVLNCDGPRASDLQLVSTGRGIQFEV